MTHFYLVPIITYNSIYRVPKYFASRFNTTGILCQWSAMDYGLHPYILILAKDITVADDAFLALQPDVYSFPLNLDLAITPTDNLKSFFEVIKVPTDWLTAATTYRQFLRMMAALFQFAQRYHGISGQALLSGSITLESRYNDLTAQQKTWFNQTITSFGYDPTLVSGNKKFRLMLKSIADFWGAQPFILGGVEF